MRWKEKIVVKDNPSCAICQHRDNCEKWEQKLFFFYQIDHPAIDASKSLFPKVVSIQRKRAVIACFRQTSLYSLPRHIAINLFLRTYRELWLDDENSGQEVLIDHLTVCVQPPKFFIMKP